MHSLAPISIQRTVDSSTEPVSLAEAKEHLRIVDYTDDDTYIELLITTARQTVERATRRALWTGQSWQAAYTGWPWSCYRRFSLPKPPLAAVSAVQYYDEDNALQTLAAAKYVIDSSGADRAWLAFKTTASLPTLSCDYPAPVRVTYTAGYADQDALPNGLRHAILYMIQHLYDNRSPVGINVNISTMPQSFQYLCDQHKIPNRA